MWVLHFDVLSQKRAGSYRKSLMFKTCQAGGLTKVSTHGSAPDEPKKKIKKKKVDEESHVQALNKQNAHLGGESTDRLECIGRE